VGKGTAEEPASAPAGASAPKHNARHAALSCMDLRLDMGSLPAFDVEDDFWRLPFVRRKGKQEKSSSDTNSQLAILTGCSNAAVLRVLACFNRSRHECDGGI